MTDEFDNSESFADDMAEYLPTFLDETEEQLDDLVETLLTLESDPDNHDALNEAFRLIHSIKGSAGIMGFENITVLTHHLENRFEQFRSGSAHLDESTMNLVLRCIDFLRTCNERLRTGQPLSSASELLAELKRLEEQPEEQPPTSVVETVMPMTTEQSATAAQSAPSLSRIPTELISDKSLVRMVVKFRAGLHLVDLKTQLIVSRLSSLGEVTFTIPEIDKLSEFEKLEQFEAYIQSDEDHSRLQSAAEVDGVESIEIDNYSSEPAKPIVNQDIDGVAGEIEFDEPESTTLSDTPSFLPDQSAAENRSERDSEQVTTNGSSSASSPARRLEPGSSKITESMRVEIDRLDNLMNLAGELVVNRARFEQISAEVNPEMRKTNMLNRIREFSNSLREAIEGMEKLENSEIDWSTKIQHLRSGLELMEEQSVLWSNGRQYVHEVGEAIDQLARVSQGLRQGVLETRMIAVAPLFNRFRRVVRDLSKERGKQVNLLIEGEKTELDKRMIDELGDPLVHLVRNSIDHGLETLDDRVAKGKPGPGNISLKASHRGNNVYIVVRDDGNGIDSEKIKAKLVDRKILSKSAAGELTREQVLDYIWHPGFSTAQEVTDVSGRGVGMDVVQTRIEQLNGTIQVDSTPGEGTTFTIRLPLTLAIITSLLVRCRNVTFSLPIDDVREIVSVDREKIVTVLGKQTFEVRGEYIPLLTVEDIFHWHNIDYGRGTARVVCDNDAAGKTEIVILHAAGKKIGLHVDELVGSQDLVIKSLSDNFMGIRGLSGASILGDGSICLMLEVGSFIDMAIKSTLDSRNVEPID